ncbi:hypothetical protein NVP1215B_031 [Vibrio phage 1.215.B._10N.222.54.F7]|nr:hypothetical protein NVP1215A_031 [Vibrio phage 1.215.A._10N.222.54.F7]AUR96054.1 hypothetical protein NVP1215B_031 [Vibrio phage 1.215.B._10N.222.54.F7]
MLEVSKKCCGQCLFTKNKIVSDERRDSLIKETVAADTHFICHKGSIIGKDIVCRGFYDKHPSTLIQVSERLGMVKEVDADALLEDYRKEKGL